MPDIRAGDNVKIGNGKEVWRVIAAYPGRVIVNRLVPGNTRTGWRNLRRYLDPAKTKIVKVERNA